MSDHADLPIAVLISGGGTTLRNLIDQQRSGNLPVEFRVVISSSPDARGLQFAEESNIPSLVVQRNAVDSADDFSNSIFEPIRKAQVSLVVMGGFLKHLFIPSDFEGRVINIHPALIPAFCGKGYYGLRVHQAVLDYGAKISGCTVHFVDNQYDHGPIILQRAVPVLDDDSAESLATRVFQTECRAYPEAIRLIASNRVDLQDRRVRVRD